MAHFPQPHVAQRAPRIRITRRVPITISMQGIQSDGLLASISRTGGLALVPRALPAGALVEINFKTSHGAVTSIAELLPPRQALDGVMQPFRHIALSDEDHINLVHGIDSLGN